jgi:dihydroorotate dehydrogenase electron transfer subunit
MAIVEENRPLGAGVFLLRMRQERIAAGVRPGRFVMIDCAPRGALDPMLRRPFSVQRVDGEHFEILCRVVGQGTALMAKMLKGEEVRVLGPLGNAFTMPARGETAVLLGGGVGIPPLVAMADALVAAGRRDWMAFLGVRDASDAGCFVGFDSDARYAAGSGREGQVQRATLDGSLGFRGNVLEAWLDWRVRSAAAAGGQPAPSRVYACGPTRMLQAVAETAAGLGLRCEVSVETLMGCGLGACMACIVGNADARDPERRKQLNPYDRWLLACRKGPVFDAGRIDLSEGAFVH